MDTPPWVPAAEDTEVPSIKWPWACMELVEPILLYTDSYARIAYHGMPGERHSK